MGDLESATPWCLNVTRRLYRFVNITDFLRGEIDQVCAIFEARTRGSGNKKTCTTFFVRFSMREARFTFAPTAVNSSRCGMPMLPTWRLRSAVTEASMAENNRAKSNDRAIAL